MSLLSPSPSRFSTWHSSMSPFDLQALPHLAHGPLQPQHLSPPLFSSAPATLAPLQSLQCSSACCSVCLEGLSLRPMLLGLRLNTTLSGKPSPPPDTFPSHTILPPGFIFSLALSPPACPVVSQLPQNNPCLGGALSLTGVSTASPGKCLWG